MNERLQFRLGAIGGLLGTAGGAQGTGISGPAQADQTGFNNLQTTFQGLQGVANGTGPNPAMAQYNQNVQNLAKQQSGAISSVQGISPALAARMATQQGSAAMQNAAAQGATTQAQQQLGAMGQMAGVANSQAANSVAQQSNINNVNGTMAGTVMQGQQGLIGGAMSGAGAAMGMADGGEVPSSDAFSFGAPQSKFAQYLKGAPQQDPAMATSGSGALQQGMSSMVQGALSKKKPAPQNSGQGPTVANDASIGAGIPYTQPLGLGYGAAPAFARGGNVPAMVSPGERYLPPSAVKKVVMGKDPMKVGEKIPGKPKVPGNSYANDVVPKKLAAGGVVIPNSIMQSKNPAKGARDMVAAIIAKRGKK